MANMSKDTARERANLDPITGAPGSHPVGTGLGAAGGAAAGAAVGAAAGPVGAVVGAVVGGVAGGLAGKGVAEMIDPTVEGTYWRENFASRPYASGAAYDDFEPAYRYGWETYPQFAGTPFEEAEPQLRSQWDYRRGDSDLSWDRARLAAKDSWQRLSDNIERAIPGDSDRDGK
ncbi:MAG TPA: hypothetical protein VFQ55_18210 [Casimicrobiaceae bacterium]|nr:hypothetical protein [Casimicrobiaceae bacterium]